MLLKLDAPEAATQRAGDWFRAVVYKIDFNDHIRPRGIRQRQSRRDAWVFECDDASHREINIAPDAGVSSSYGRYPVPADGGVIGGIVVAQSATILARALEGLLFRTPRIGVLLD